MLNTNPIKGLSYVIGDKSEPLSEQTIPELLARTASAFPDREAVVFPTQDIRWTWREFTRQVDRLAGGLISLGVRKGDRVGITTLEDGKKVRVFKSNGETVDV